MTSVHGLQHVECFTAADLADDDAVGAHTQRVADEVTDADLSPALDVRRARFEREHVLLVELEFLRVFDSDDAFVARDEARQHVQQRRLPGTGPAADHDVQAPAHAQVDEVRDLRRERAERDEVVDGVRILRELSDRHERPADRERVHDHVHAGAVGQARVDHGVRLVDTPADLAHDLVDDAAHVRLVDETHRGLLDAPRALDVDMRGTVDHDFGDAAVAQQLVDGSVTEDVVGHRLHELLPLGAREREPLLRERAVQLLVDLAAQVGFAHALVVEQRSQFVDDELVHLLPHLLERLLALRGAGGAFGPTGLLGAAGRRLTVRGRCRRRRPLRRRALRRRPRRWR